MNGGGTFSQGGHIRMTDYIELALSFIESNDVKDCFRNALLTNDDSVRVQSYCCDIIVGSRAIAFPFNIDTFFTIIEPKFSISPTTSPTKKC